MFNNAGVAVASSVLDADPDDDEWLRQINFDGVVNGTRAFLPILVEQDEGVMVNTSSVFGLLGMPYQSAYCASKFAVRGFTEALRQELRGTGVSAVTVHPGGIRTNIARNARIRKDPEGRGRTHEQMAAEFEAITMTSPDKAAEIICRGVERGKARILVGPDAYVFDALARVAPTHYYDVMARFEKRLRSGRRSSVSEHVDVLIVGAGLSGIGAAHHLQAALPARPTPSWRPATPSAAPGTCSATRACGRTRTCTHSATGSGRGRRPRRSRTGPRSCATSGTPRPRRASTSTSASVTG